MVSEKGCKSPFLLPCVKASLRTCVGFSFNKININKLACSNPKLINNGVTQQFGFTATFRPYGSDVVINNTDTILLSGTATMVTEITRPSGVLTSSSINVTTISPTILQVNLEGGNAFYGTYHIKSTLTDSVGSYVIEYDVKVCETEGISLPSNVGVGKIGAEVNCIKANVLVSDAGEYLFLGKSPISTTRELSITKPNNPTKVESAHVPYILNLKNEISGKYDFELTTYATYEIGCSNFITHKYVSNEQKNITCNNKLCDLTCCLQEIDEIINAGGENSALYKSKKEENQIKIDRAILSFICGEDITEIVDEIRTIFNCKCKCKEASQTIMPTPTTFGSGNNPTTLVGAGGTSVSVAGDTATISSFIYQLAKCNALDRILEITKTTVGNTITYCLEINVEELTKSVLTEIENTENFITQLANIINTYNIQNGGGSGGSNSIYVDWKGITRPICNYTNVIVDFTPTNYFYGIEANGNTALIPTPTQSALAIKNYLNSLNIGVFDAVINVDGDLLVTSVGNQNQPKNILYNNTSSGTAYKKSVFNSPCYNAENVIQHIIDNMCPCDSCAPLQFIVTEIAQGQFKVTVLGLDSGEVYGLSTNNGTTFVNTLENPKVVMGLTSNTAYDVVLKRTCRGTEVISPKQVIVTNPIPLPCSTPQAVVTILSSTSVKIGINNYVSGDTYNITYGGTTIPATQPETIITGLTAGAAYTLIVTHVCANGTSSTQPESFVTTNPACQVSGLSIVSFTQTSVTIGFTPLVAYPTYVAKIYDGVTNAYLGTSGAGGNPITVTGLQPNKSYKFEISPIGGCQAEPQIANISQTTASGVTSYAYVANRGTTIVLDGGTYKDSIALGNSYCITGNGLTQTVYTNTPATPDTGDTIYIDSLLNNKLLGYSYIRFGTATGVGSCRVYNINPLTGVLGSYYGTI